MYLYVLYRNLKNLLERLNCKVPQGELIEKGSLFKKALNNCI